MAAAYALNKPDETYKEIAERFGCNPGSLSVIVSKMQKGLDVSEPTPEVDEATGTSEVILP